ncbi:3-deoxy-D-manno-octulosonate 8-phosphate phosphatase (KDO 8-P phosphatase) [Pseudoxanthomonas japonensis]|uniref:KdsC family phosphatase n=1 Tax=Pseudoxanthomonas japonensis TaxID=69284 RepID=UPI001A5B6624|nr:HAD hydrolase family protein [Pseudoxanthomonas japonensis]MBA3931255.1 phenylphosphate carboxylase subunit delta [Xanthomonas sp.]MBL8255306.1 HAD hydrolase family protein [Pseudoxanthomonas mexicana]MDR7067790.1 3-deoxy-D-manno-octulosonate 8-phosphate phosphatase (KDO 8-P phosphatase) [Pseudoxanthomonas japonensis]
MPLRHLHDLTEDVLARAARIRLACFDVDGTLTDGRLFLDGEGREQKAFHVQDGQGLVLLKRAGIEVAFITARSGTVAVARGRELGVQVFTGVKDKLAKVRELAAGLGIGLGQVAFMGDDLPDVPPFRAVGLAIAPADAHPWTAQHAHWRTRRAGGQGAAREACDLLLGTQGHAPTLEGGTA